MKKICLTKEGLKNFFDADAELWDALAEVESETVFYIYEDGTIYREGWLTNPFYEVEPEEVENLFFE